MVHFHPVFCSHFSQPLYVQSIFELALMQRLLQLEFAHFSRDLDFLPSNEFKLVYMVATPYSAKGVPPVSVLLGITPSWTRDRNRVPGIELGLATFKASNLFAIYCHPSPNLK